MIVVLAGGVGAAKFLQGLTRVVRDEELVIVANIGDDVEFFGLHISPDLDTLMYALAGLVDEEKGWGLRGDSFNFLQMIEDYGYEAWFRVGDKDLATHILRTHLLQGGYSLSEVTRKFCNDLQVRQVILPVTDDSVRTRVETDDGLLDFQEYFVKRRFEANVRNILFEGSESARPNPEVLEAIGRSRGIIFAPSNPIVSIGCILSIRGVREALKESEVRKVAITPLIAGKPVRGPADRMMRGLGMESSAFGVAVVYRGLIDSLIIDEQDSNLKDRIEGLGIQAVTTNTLMTTLESKIMLAEIALKALKG